MGTLSQAPYHFRRRADPGDARLGFRSLFEVLRGAASNEGHRRYIFHRRLWATASEAERFAEPLGFFPRAKGRLSYASHREKIRDTLRSVCYFLHPLFFWP